MTVILLVIGLIVAILAVIFALQNSTPTVINFLFWPTGEVSLALVLLVTFLLGVVATVLVLLPGIIRRNTQLRGMKKKVGQMDKLVNKDEKDADEG
jgi:lipopolysaccharide assembly protein A